MQFLCISCASDVSPIAVPHVIGGVINEGVSTEPKRTLRSVSLTRGASQMIRNEGGIGIMDEPCSYFLAGGVDAAMVWVK